MSLYLEPKSVTEKINKTLKYTVKTDIDEFTLHRYYHKLNNLKQNRVLTEDEVTAFGLVLFNMGRYKDFIALYDHAKNHYSGNLLLHTHDTLGRFHMKFSKKAILEDFDIYEYWFDKAHNRDSVEFRFFHSGRHLQFFEKLYVLEKEMVIAICLYYDKTVEIESGPFLIKRRYEEVKSNNFRFEDTVLFEYIERIRLDSVTTEETNYMKDLFGAKSHDEIVGLVNREINKETKEIIEKTDSGNDVDIFKGENGLLEYLDSNA